MQNGVPAPDVANAAAIAIVMQQQANEELARFVSEARDTLFGTMMLVLVSLPNGRVRSLLAPSSEAEQTLAAEADVEKRDAEKICRAVQSLARKNMRDARLCINFLAVSLGLASAGGPPFLGLGEEPRSPGGSSTQEWGPSWPADLPVAVAAMADRVNAFVEEHLNEGV